MSLGNQKNLIIFAAIVAALLAGTVLVGGYANILPAASDTGTQVKACQVTGLTSGCPAQNSPAQSDQGCCPAKCCPDECDKCCCPPECCPDECDECCCPAECCPDECDKCCCPAECCPTEGNKGCCGEEGAGCCG